MELQALLEPRSVAIVGASAEPKKISGMIVDFLLKSGYPGRVFPVNPRYDRIRDLRCYPSMHSIPETVDLVVYVVPVEVAFESLEVAARKGVPFCLLMSGGFGEGRSGAEGLARRDRLLRICTETGMHVVGPNTVGMVNFRHPLPLTFADWYARDTGQRGGVAIVTHSGSVGGLIFSSLQANGIGVDYWLGLGNEATLETADFIAHFSDDDTIHTIVCYMEGVSDGRKFIAAAAKARRKRKHVVVIRAGANPESARSTRSHTAKNPTRSDVYTGIFRQLGVIEATSLAELSYVMRLLSTAGDRLGSRVGIISASGGACSLIADHVVDAGLDLPELMADLQQALNRSIPEYGSSLNPVDLSADVIARPEILDGVLEVLRNDESIDVWLIFGRPIVDRYHQAFIDFARATGKAVIVSCEVQIAADLQESFQANGVTVLDDPALSMRALAQIVKAARSRAPGFDAPAELPSRTGQSVMSDADAAATLLGHGFTALTGRAPVMHAGVDIDREFGPVVSASALACTGASLQRVVRALPVTREALHDAARELTSNEPGLQAYAEDVERSMIAVTEIYSMRTDLARIGVLFSMSNDGLTVCRDSTASVSN
jgi:acyl-CoA synthetase (NDP forming)